jgi:hypothetical protein
MLQIRQLVLLPLAATLDLQAGAPAYDQVSCRPNVFGGYDCTGPGGWRSTSRPNVFGGTDTTYLGGARTSSRPNVFGGETITTQAGPIESRPNIFGGRTIVSRTARACSRVRTSSVPRTSLAVMVSACGVGRTSLAARIASRAELTAAASQGTGFDAAEPALSDPKILRS